MFKVLFIEIVFSNVSISFTLYVFHKIQKANIKNKSLNLLKANAFKLQVRVVDLNFQKLISKKEVNPISSHPNIKVKKLFPDTKIIIDNTNQLISNVNSSALSSYLK